MSQSNPSDISRSASGRRTCLSWGLAAGGIVLSAGLWGCDRGPQSIDKLKVAHAYQASFGLIYVADQAGFFKKEGLEIEFLRFGFGREALLATQDGRADLATPFDTPIALAILKNEPVRVLSSLSVLLGNAQVLSNKQHGIRTPADLKGRRIGFIPNTSGEYILSMVLANAGIEDSQITGMPMSSPDDLKRALVQGDVDAAALWAPLTQLAKNEMGADAVVGFTSPTYVETALLTTTEGVLQKKRSAINKFMSALVKAENMVLREPQKALQYIQAALPDTPTDVVKQTWASLQPQIRLDNQMSVSLENQMRWFLKKQGKDMEQVPNVRQNLADEVLRGIQPQAVTLKSVR
jgi:ABC-type nitrate/sulfonate/bicarbonate transport system substrate-binding protein